MLHNGINIKTMCPTYSCGISVPVGSFMLRVIDCDVM